MNKKKLVIISDTHMWRKEGEFFVFEPTLREVEFLTNIFHEITWLGFDHGNSPEPNARKDKTKKIIFKLLPHARGGERPLAKLKIIPKIPWLIYFILKSVRGGDVIHSRGPSVPAIIGIVISFFYTKKIFWHKYAGNWVQKNPPLSYAIQRFLLKKLRRHIVTVNGLWESDNKNVICLENPCFSMEELERARNVAEKKIFSSSLSILFVGRVEREKGIFILLEALKQISKEILPSFKNLTIVGSGRHIKEAMAMVSQIPIPVIFKGPVSRQNLIGLYEEAHMMVLPSTASEGFPKVVAECSAFGCIPIVSSISSITQYILNDINGVVLDEVSIKNVVLKLTQLTLDRELLRKMAAQSVKVAERFTYERYNERIFKEVVLKSNT